MERSSSSVRRPMEGAARVIGLAPDSPPPRHARRSWEVARRPSGAANDWHLLCTSGSGQSGSSHRHLIAPIASRLPPAFHSPLISEESAMKKLALALLISGTLAGGVAVAQTGNQQQSANQQQSQQIYRLIKTHGRSYGILRK